MNICISLFYFVLFNQGEKVQFIKRHLGIMSAFHPQEERQLARDFVLHYLKDDGVFVTRLLSVNSSDLVVTEIINQLWIRFKTANRIYSPSQSQQQNSNDDNIDTSMLGINSIPQNGNTINNHHHRQRLSRIPPPPLPLYTPRTIHQQTKTEKSEDNIKSAKDTDV
jgi:hypothetical protein